VIANGEQRHHDAKYLFDYLTNARFAPILVLEQLAQAGDQRLYPLIRLSLAAIFGSAALD
jgi:hypothetical protein